VKLAVVVQRYGADVSGGAELHARYIAEHLSRHAEICVLTTCARDYVTWRNEYAPGSDTLNGVRIKRFRVDAERDAHAFGLQSARVFEARHSVQDELEWLDSQGPVSSGLVQELRGNGRAFDYLLLFSARYYQSFHGARAVPERAVLVPTAERDPTLGLSLLGPVFRGVRAIMYNSFEERALIQSAYSNHQVPNVVVGVGSAIPADVEPGRFRHKYGVAGPYLIYVGRIDENKGCAELFDYFMRYADARPNAPRLLLIGTPVIPVPQHAAITHLGAVSDEDKFDAIAGAAALVMPSRYESLSMVALEAWALGRPVLANARCDVLLGQCVRSNAGLYYEDSIEFAATLDRLLSDARMADALGRNGRAFFERHYAWSVIEKKYLDMFARLDKDRRANRMEPLPGWWARRKRNLAPAADVVRALPSGPVLGPKHCGDGRGGAV
jgi:glycosyltransferase involved in cell wall biosynthesis